MGRHHIVIRRNGSVYGRVGAYADRADALADAASFGGPGLSVTVESERAAPKRSKREKARRNRADDWIQQVQADIEADGTEGAFTAQAKRAGYPDARSFADAIMSRWRRGKRDVYNRKTHRYQGVTAKTMRRALFVQNTTIRRNGVAAGALIHALAPIVVKAVVGVSQRRLRHFEGMSRSDQRAAIRAPFARGWNPTHVMMRRVLKSDATADFVVDLLREIAQSDDAKRVLQQTAREAASVQTKLA